MMSETKEQKFVRIAEGRVDAITERIRLLSQLSNRRNYSYTEEQIAKIFRAINRELRSAKEQFTGDSSTKNKFKL